MDPRPPAPLERPGAFLDVGFYSTAQRANYRSVDFTTDRLHRLEVFRRRGGIPGLDHIYLQIRELSGEDQLLPPAETRPGGLFPIAQGGVENFYFVRHLAALSILLTFLGEMDSFSATLETLRPSRSHTMGMTMRANSSVIC